VNERRIACVDLNGVLDAYTGWRGADHFDPPRPGARAFLEALAACDFHVVVFTTRWPDDVWRWLKEHGFVDDRAVCFRGDFADTLREIDRFAAHWES